MRKFVVNEIRYNTNLYVSDNHRLASVSPCRHPVERCSLLASWFVNRVVSDLCLGPGPGSAEALPE